MKSLLFEKLKESLQAVLPIGSIIVVLNFTLVHMPLGVLALMLVGMVMLIVGLTLFSLGTEMAMMPMGEHIGSALIRSKNLLLIVVSLFIFGFAVTAAEPDLQVLANQVQSIPNIVLIVGIAVGVGIFLVLAALRILFRWWLSSLLIVSYAVAFLLAIFSTEYMAVSFDASAVTTGPITVPFLLAIGGGFAASTGSKNADEDNFGICALCSVGPILAVLIMGFFFSSQNDHYTGAVDAAVHSVKGLLILFTNGIWHTFREVIFVVLPIVVIFLIFQVIRLKLSKTELIKIFIGLGYLVAGLTIFLAGVNNGFMPAATYLGEGMGALPFNWILVPLCVLIGACVVLAEPAVHVLTKQVEEITSGAISRKMMLFGMTLGVGLAMSLSMVRILAGLSIWWFLLPGFGLALLLTFFVPSMFVGIGFDSGGVAAGAMSAAFVLPFAIGVCTAVGGNVLTNAFGAVGMIAMMPPITVQIMGVIYKAKLKKARQAELLAEEQDAEQTESNCAG